MVDAAVQIRLDALVRMWESLAIRQLGVLEIVGSSPTILTDRLWCGVTVACLVVTHEVKVRFLPPQLAACGLALARRQLSAKPQAAKTRLCSWESSQPPKLTEWVRILPTLLNGPGTGR